MMMMMVVMMSRKSVLVILGNRAPKAVAGEVCILDCLTVMLERSQKMID
jgi:hypothetical protein